MMPRPLLRDTFGLTYRKIPVLAIGRDVYCDTSLIVEALERRFEEKEGYGTVYPRAGDGKRNRGIIRGFASYWTDRPLFRVTTGLIPPTVWRTSFGADRADLIGHALDPEKLARKIPLNLSNLDLHLSLLEPQFHCGIHTGSPYIFSTPTPSLADISLYYQLTWAADIAAGRGLYNLTGGGTADADAANTSTTSSFLDRILSAPRYPALHRWRSSFSSYIASLPSTETHVVNPTADTAWRDGIAAQQPLEGDELLLPTPAAALAELDAALGLRKGAGVSVAPDDTGRGDPTVGRLVGWGPEEVVVEPEEEGIVPGVRVHFPRLGFVVKSVGGSGSGGRARL
ncbi:hypothetical protein K432DRAFT_296993 [Lepidopterella palustris CBS 459.81]|uniref:DUF7962 domain-containing protein n=1 Tax=Lepidopterella palustris CBS 459.81 TaxID=1314670 RepID=A0A8E2JFM4_9PEZI|nr:hypothetical protein K432DRAFT_296993 [Lepidopterella palustris CBS 459.81]